MAQKKTWPKPEGEPFKFDRGGITWRELIKKLSELPDWMLDEQATVYLDDCSDIRLGEENPISDLVPYRTEYPTFEPAFDSYEDTVMLCLWDKE